MQFQEKGYTREHFYASSPVSAGPMNGSDRSGIPGGRAFPGLFAWQVLFLAWVCGLLAAAHPEALCGVPLLWFLCRRLRARPVSLAALVLCGGLGLGWALLRAPVPAPEAPAWMEQGREVEFSGVVDAVQTRPNRRLVMFLRQASCVVDGEEWHAPGLVAWTWELPAARPLPGQEVLLRTRLWSVQGLDNPGIWDGADYWERQGVAFRTASLGRAPGIVLGPAPAPGPGGLRQLLRQETEALVPATQGGAVVLAVLTGDRFLLAPATLELMRHAGLSHSLALSGLHLGFVAAVGAALAYGLSLLWPGVCLLLPRPKLAVLTAAPLVLAYAWLGQPAPSLVRAACMFLSWGLLLLWDRQRVLLDGLFLALALILVIAPGEVQELSLQLSAVAVAGIAAFWAPLWHWVPKRGGVWRALRWALGLLLVSLCANLALLPLQVWHFGVLSPNFLANVFWLPVLGLLIMPLGLAGLALLGLWPGAAAACLAGAAFLADASLDVLARTDAWGWLPLIQTLRPLWPELLGGALLLACLPLLLRRAAVPAPVLGLGLFLLLVPHAWIMVRDTLNGPSLTLLDVGQGQAALLTLPGGRRVLVDGGGFRSATFDLGRSVVAPALTWGRPPRLAAVLLSQGTYEHARGLAAVLAGFRVGFFGSAQEPPESLRRILRGRGLAQVRLAAGQDLDLGSGFSLEVLAPWEPASARRRNAVPLALRLVWNGQGLALLPGDQDAAGLRRLLASGRDLRAGVLVLPDHGSGAACVAEFYEAVAPALALASCGRRPPAESVRQALEQRGASLWTTAGCGRLRVFWDAPGVFARAGSGRTCSALEMDILP